MLKLTLKQLSNSYAAFSELAAQKISNQKLAYNLAKTFKKMSAELELAQERQVDIIKKFGGTQKGGRWQIEFAEDTDPATREAFDAQFKDLSDIEIELWGNKLKFSELVAAKLELSPASLAALDEWFIEDDSDLASSETT